MVARDLDAGRWLRPFVAADADELYALIDSNREMLARWMPWASGQTRRGAADFIARATRADAAQDGATAAIVQDGTIVGCVSLDERSRANAHAKVGYWLASHAQGRGTMTLAVAAMLDHGFGAWDLRRIELRAGVENSASRAVAQRLGFTGEGVRRQAERVGDRWIDHAVYALLADEWRRSRSRRSPLRRDAGAGSAGATPDPRPPTGAAFAPGAGTWLAHLGSVRDAVRQTLVAEQLRAQLPARPLTVLDAGCGQGSQAIALARDGHTVTGVDSDERMLHAAREAVSAEPPAVRRRITLRAGDVRSLEPATADVVCCHGVAMYVPSLRELVGSLAGAARPGGVVSLLTRNRAGLAMRAGMDGRYREAAGAFDAVRYTNRLGIEDARADDPAEVRATLDAAGATPLAWYGVRLFSDPLGADAVVDDLAGLLAAEREAAVRDPYRALAALTHTLARVS